MTPQEYFLFKYRASKGFNPNEPMSFKERLHWKKIEMQRNFCRRTTSAYASISMAPYFDKQYFLAKWWDKLNQEDKKSYLEMVWLQKGDCPIYGYDWWIPYFEEIGFIANNGFEKPLQPITLYRGSRPSYILGMSWTDQIEAAELFKNYSLLGGLPPKKIYKTVVQPESVLAIFSGIDPKLHETLMVREYVLNHQHLNLSEIEEVEFPQKEDDGVAT